MAAAARAFCLLSILVVELVIPHLPAEELGAASVALEAGDECYADANESGAAADSACALSALQHHGQKLALETLVADQAEALGVGVGAETEDLADTGVNCKKYGCSDDFVPAHRCQCNSNCHKRKDCCYDYASTCRATSSWAKVLPSHGVHGHPSSSVDYPKYPGFTLRVAEEFEVPIDLETDPIWTWSDGGLKEGQVRFVKQAIRFEGGKMKIEVSKNDGVNVEPCSHAEVAYVERKPLVSGELRSRNNMFRYGRYEMRMKAPDVHPGRPEMDGNFASTMFVFRDGKFKHWREIDVEIVGSGDMFTNVLNAENTATWRASIQREAHMYVGPSTRASFHTYAFEWLPDKITWYFDGKIVREHTLGHGVAIPDLSGKVIMNLWVFGPSAAFGGKHIKNNQYPMHSEYEYFRFYSWDGDTLYPCQGMGTSCLTPDDHYLSGNNPCDGIPQADFIDGHKPCHAVCKS